MPEIGATLREARMRAKVDISEVESETKIRAKYLRALENEEWNLLPGPTYVKTFLRTYAEFLGLEPRLLVEEYKQRYERVSEAELTPIAPLGPDRRSRGPRGPSSRTMALAFAFLGLAAALFVLSRVGGDDDPAPVSTPPPASQTTADDEEPAADPQRDEDAEPQRPRRIRLTLIPTGNVYVCLVNARGTQVIPGEILTPENAGRVYTSSSFRMTLGNNSIRLRINGRTRQVPASSEPIGYRITPADGRQELEADERPSCT
jgi:hypothetical protein